MSCYKTKEKLKHNKINVSFYGKIWEELWHGLLNMKLKI